jgi:biopolymer transport protein ExbD
VKRRRAGRRRIAHPNNLKMTSMVDILTTLLLFLLKSFVAGGEAVLPPPGVTLPESTSQVPPEATLVVAISDDAILLGSEPVASVAAALASESLVIGELEAGLDRALTQMEGIATRKASGEIPYEVTIQGDRDLEFRLLQKVMHTCSVSGIDEMALAVVQKGGS